MLVRSLAIAALVLGVSACNASAAPQPSATPSASPYAAVSVGATEVQQALNVAIKALQGPAWLNDSTLAPQQISDAEEQGTPARTIRFTLQALNHGKVRMLRPTLAWDAQGHGTLESLELGPPGSTAPLRAVPGANNLPGGFTQQSPTGADMTAAASQALQLLGGADWFGHPFKLVRLNTAMTQVVAGLNTYLDLTVTAGGQTREVGLIMYRDFRGGTSLSWARLALPSAGS